MGDSLSGMDAAVAIPAPSVTTVPLSGTQWTIAAGEQRAVVVEVGGGVREYAAGGVEYLDSYAEDELCPGAAGQVMAPWPNRLRDGRYTFRGQEYQLPLSEPLRHNAIHGLTRWARWRAVQVTGDAVTMEHELVPQPGYPWPLLLRTTWSVGPDGLTAEHAVTNLGQRPCPFGLGVHPYLRIPGVCVDELRLRVPARSRLLLDGRLLPIGVARVSDSYDFTSARPIGADLLDLAFGDLDRDEEGGSAVQLSTVDGRGVTVWADAAFNWWQVFTGDTLSPVRRRRSVAIEPMTCPADGLRSGRHLVVLEPGQTWSGRWGIRPGC